LKTRAFSLVEVLVAMGLTLLLLGLAVGMLSGVRQQARGTHSLANIRQMGAGLTMYTVISRDLPPTFGVPVWPPAQPWAFEFGSLGTGSWFEHEWLYAVAITALLGDAKAATAPGNPAPRTVSDSGIALSDYWLTGALYAEPRFFNWGTRLGVSQFAPQPFTSIRYPSSKGVLAQMVAYEGGESRQTCCTTDVHSAVLFADSSAESLVRRRLNRGIYNIYGSGMIPPAWTPSPSGARRCSTPSTESMGATARPARPTFSRPPLPGVFRPAPAPVALRQLVEPLGDLPQVQGVVRRPRGEQVARGDGPPARVRVSARPVGVGESPEPGDGLAPGGHEPPHLLDEVLRVVAASAGPPLGVDRRPRRARVAQRQEDACAEVLDLLVRQVADDLEHRPGTPRRFPAGRLRVDARHHRGQGRAKALQAVDQQAGAGLVHESPV